MRYGRYRAKRQASRDCRQSNTGRSERVKLLDEIMKICVAYSALISLVILTKYYLMHNKYVVLLCISVFVIIVTLFALIFDLLYMFKSLKSLVMFLVITTTIVIALDISLSIYMVPIFKYIYKTF